MNIPNCQLHKAKNIMAIGLGGGFDIFAALPFVYHFNDKNFVLVNSSPTNKFHYRESTIQDYPEGLIADENNIIAKYSVGRHGAIAVKKAYQEIVNKHQIDIVLAIDGGVDSLSIGDEENYGTILEDFIAIAALDEINIEKVFCCVGFGTETEEELNHYRTLENMVALADAFIGSFSLTKNMPEFIKYSLQCEQTWTNNRKSHIHTKIISAVLGNFGTNNKYKDVDPRIANAVENVFISPLSSIFWIYNFNAIVRRNKIIDVLKKGNTFANSKIILRNYLNTNACTRSKLPLPL